MHWLDIHNPEVAFTLAEKLQNNGKNWVISNVICKKSTSNLAELQQQIELLKLATLPISTRNQIIQQPERYFQQYAEQIINPFGYQKFAPLGTRLAWFLGVLYCRNLNSKVKFSGMQKQVYYAV